MKTNSTKKALLASLLSLLLCASMLVGSTFAWFTDTASTAVNSIQAGTLKVELWKGDSDESLGSEALKWVAADGRAQDAILWEPGATYSLESFRIKNAGNLALKYKVVINGLVGSAKLLEVIDFTVAVEGNALEAKDGTSTATTAATLNNFEGKLGAGAVTGKITITGHMKEDAGNEYMNEKIEGVSITVVATQDTVEKDGTGDQYDKDATYPSSFGGAKTLVEGLKKKDSKIIINGNTTIDGDVDANGVVNPDAEVQMKNAGTVEMTLNGTLTSGNIGGGTWGCMRVMPGTTLVVSGDDNGKFINTSSNSMINIGGGEVIINGGYFESAAACFWLYTTDDAVLHDSKLTINGGTFKGEEGLLSSNYANFGTVIITGGTFYKFDPSNVTFAWGSSCTVKVADGYTVVRNGDWYTVVEAKVVNSNEEFNAALAAAEAGTVILLNCDITELTVDVASIPSGVIIDGQGSYGISRSVTLKLAGCDNITIRNVSLGG